MLEIAVIGAGNMGGALVKGWSRAALDVNITVAVHKVEKAIALQAESPTFSIVTDNVEAVENADVIVIAVKPWQVGAVMDEIKSSFKKGAVLVSVAAGISCEELKQMVQTDGADAPHIFNVIPNIAAEFSESMTFIAPAASVPNDVIDKVRNLFEYLGSTVICTEKQLYSGMLLSSCGLAYVMRILRAQQEAGVEMGFKPSEALDIAMQTMAGAVSLLRGTGEHPSEAIDRVATPGGYTIKGLNEMDHSGLVSALIKVFETGFKK